MTPYVESRAYILNVPGPYLVVTRIAVGGDGEVGGNEGVVALGEGGRDRYLRPQNEII